MTYRIEIYRPHPDNPDVLSRHWANEEDVFAPRDQFVRGLLRRPGTFAIVLRIDGTTETVLERWRVAADGRILRARFTELEPELEQT